MMTDKHYWVNSSFTGKVALLLYIYLVLISPLPDVIYITLCLYQKLQKGCLLPVSLNMDEKYNVKGHLHLCRDNFSVPTYRPKSPHENVMSPHGYRKGPDKYHFMLTRNVSLQQKPQTRPEIHNEIEEAIMSKQFPMHFLN